jgi:hypothetical protein
MSASGISGMVQLAKRHPLVIPKPGLSARNLLAASSEAADSSRHNAALRNGNSLGILALADIHSGRQFGGARQVLRD